MLKKFEIEPKDYRDAMALFAGAVHVVTTDGKAGRRGVTVIAACSVSDNPPMVLVCINRENAANDAFAENGCFALNTLAERHQALAHGFSGLTGMTREERFTLGEWHALATGAPVLADPLAAFDCEIVETKDMATHRIHFGRVRGLLTGTGAPLIYHARGYGIRAAGEMDRP